MVAIEKTEATPLDLSGPLGHHDALHSAPHGTAIYWQRKAQKGKRWVKIAPDDPIVPQLVSRQEGRQDRYLTVNQFFQWRLVRLVRSLRACYVDVDHITDLEWARERLAEQGLPDPSAVVYSGTGMHLYWLLEPAPARALPVWQRIQDTLVRALATESGEAGADMRARDCARVLRVAGSIHGTTGRVVEGRILSGEYWPLSMLANEVLGERVPGRQRMEYPSKHGESATVRDIRPKQQRNSTSASIYHRWHHVYRDLVTIAEHNWWGGIEEGHRDTWLFLTSVSLSWFAHTDTLQPEIVSQARAWIPTLSDADVRQLMNPVIKRARAAQEGHCIQWGGEWVDPRYRFRRRTLWDWCRGMIDDELVPQLRAIIPDEVAQQRRAEAKTKRRRAAGVRSRQEYEASSARRQRPWEALGMSRATWYRKGKPRP